MKEFLKKKCEFEKGLKKKYPNLYFYLYHEDRTVSLMHYGLNIPEGWFSLIDELSEKIEKIIVEEKLYRPVCIHCYRTKKYHYIYNIILNIKFFLIGIFTNKKYKTHNYTEDKLAAVQVKSKFNGLRFYMSFYHEKIQQLINEAERKTHTMCVKCGASGRLSAINATYIHILCDKHHNEWVRSKAAKKAWATRKKNKE